MKNSFLPVILTTVILWNCKKELEPPASTAIYGNLTFGAKVNGKIFYVNMNNHNSCGPNEGPIHTNILNSLGKQWFIIHANGNRESIYIRLEMPLQPGKHKLIGYPSFKGGESLHYAYYARADLAGNTTLYETTDEVTGTVEVLAFDTRTNGKINMVFDFTAKNKDNAETVHITDGIFKNFR